MAIHWKRLKKTRKAISGIVKLRKRDKGQTVANSTLEGAKGSLRAMRPEDN